MSIDKDAAEQQNAIADQAELTETLATLLQAHRVSTGTRAAVADWPPLDPETRRRLNALGYLE